MQNTPTAHFLNVRSRQAPGLPLHTSVWPWTTGAVALAAIATGMALILFVEWTLVGPSPAVQAAEARYDAELRQNKLSAEARTRLDKLSPLLTQLETARAALRGTLRDDLGLFGDGVSYQDFETPKELDFVMVEEETASTSWSTIQTALSLPPTVQRLSSLAAAYSQQSIFDAPDIVSLDNAAKEAASALEQLTVAKQAADHLTTLLQAQRLRPRSSTTKEP